MGIKVYIVGAGPGDPELITVKAKRLVESSKICIYAGSLVSDQVLALIPAGAEKHNSAKMNLDEVIEVVKRAEREGNDVVRLHTGDPSIYGAIKEQIVELDKLGIEYEVVPGVSSFQASAAQLCKELTAPEVSQTIILTRMAGRTPVPEEQELSKLAATQSTLCIFLSVGMMEDISAKLIPHYGEECPAYVVHRASWPDQRIVEGTLADIAVKVAEAKIERTAMILVGWALSKDGGAVSRLYAKEYSHMYRKAAE